MDKVEIVGLALCGRVAAWRSASRGSTIMVSLTAAVAAGFDITEDVSAARRVASPSSCFRADRIATAYRGRDRQQPDEG
jgi:hypothetical protein